MEDINNKIIDEYVNRLAQANHDNIVLNIQNKRLSKELEEFKEIKKEVDKEVEE